MMAVDWLPSILMAIEGSPQPLEPAAQNLAVTHSNTPSPYTQSNSFPETTTATAPSTQPQFSMMAHMILNNTCTNATLWIPNALQHHIPTQTMETDQFHHSPNPVHSPSLL